MLKKTAPWFEKDFRDEHGVGVFQFTPGEAFPTQLEEWLRECLGWSP